MTLLPFRLIAGVAIALSVLGTDAAKATPYSGLVVFGDSLSDSGNNGSLGLYAPNQVVTGNSYVATFSYAPVRTYSNGPVWASYLADTMGIGLTPSLDGGTNYANGGARLSAPGVLFGYPYSLRTQVNQFLSANGGVASPNNLYVIAGGGNDARDALAQILSKPLDTVQGFNEAIQIYESVAQSMVQSITAMVDQLQGAGAQDIVVWNLPNLGLTPEVPGAGPKQVASLVTAGWSQAIAGALAAETGVALFDVYAIASYVASHAGDFGLVNVSDVCGAAPQGTDCGTYVWWDGVHPTTRIHALLAEQMAALAGIFPPVLASARALAPFAAEDSVPEPASLALFALGLVGLVTFTMAPASRRRRAVPVRS